MMNVSEACARHIEIALSYAGCNAEDEPDRFAELVCPVTDAPSRKSFLSPNEPEDRNSSCGVAAVGFLRRVLAELERTELQEPWDFRTWWPSTVALAKTHGAYHVGGTPVLNSIFHVARGNAQHWRSIVAVHDDGSIDTIDGGGKTAKGYQLIHASKTKLVLRGGQLWDTASDKGVIEWIDVRALLESLLGAGSSTATSSPTTCSSPKAESVPPKPAPLEFIDLSAANDLPRKPDFARIRAANITGVWFHALEGNEDPIAAIAKLMPEVNAARGAGLLTGVYQECYPRHGGRAQDAEEQAQQLAEVHRGLGCELLPMAVHEDVTGKAKNYDATKRRECVEFARQHRATLTHELEREGIFYTGPGYWDHVSKDLDVSDFGDALLMCADYEKIAEARLPRGFSRVTLWQYAGGAGVIGHVDGVSTVVDRTVLFGGLDLIRA